MAAAPSAPTTVTCVVDLEEKPDFLLVVLREVAALGGIVIVLYFLLWLLNSLLTCNKFENYLVSQMYRGQDEKSLDTDHDRTMLVGN